MVWDLRFWVLDRRFSKHRLKAARSSTPIMGPTTLRNVQRQCGAMLNLKALRFRMESTAKGLGFTVILESD